MEVRADNTRGEEQHDSEHLICVTRHDRTRENMCALLPQICFFHRMTQISESSDT